MASPGPVLVVCTANVCRSPMAAALLRHALAARPSPLRELEVISAGVAARTGDKITDYSVVALRKTGLDVSGHLSRPVTQDLLDRAFAVLCMTESHRDMIRLTAEPVPKNLFLFREFAPGGPQDIADPYGCPLPVYEACRDELVEAIPSLIEALKARLAAA